MSYIGSIRRESGASRPEVAALRCYVAARAHDEPVLPLMVDLATRRGWIVTAAVALASVFELTEACLGRRLITARDDADLLSADERAALLMMAAWGEIGPRRGSETVPHGLPGALVWAIRSARQLCGCEAADDRSALDHCPFGPSLSVL